MLLIDLVKMGQQMELVEKQKMLIIVLDLQIMMMKSKTVIQYMLVTANMEKEIMELELIITIFQILEMGN